MQHLSESIQVRAVMGNQGRVVLFYACVEVSSLLSSRVINLRAKVHIHLLHALFVCIEDSRLMSQKTWL